MSDQEKFEAQGRAHAALKASKSNVATLSVSLREYAQTLRDLSQGVDRLLAGHGDLEILQRQLREMTAPHRVIIQAGEFDAESKNVQSLQEQINQF